jgi:hypothetical protein
MARQSKKMAVERLLFEQCKIILKCYWKFENVCEVQRQWKHEFAVEPPMQLTIACIHDIFEAYGTVHAVHKQRSGRPCTSLSLSSFAMVLEEFT